METQKLPEEKESKFPLFPSTKDIIEMYKVTGDDFKYLIEKAHENTYVLHYELKRILSEQEIKKIKNTMSRKLHLFKLILPRGVYPASVLTDKQFIALLRLRNNLEQNPVHLKRVYSCEQRINQINQMANTLKEKLWLILQRKGPDKTAQTIIALSNHLPAELADRILLEIKGFIECKHIENLQKRGKTETAIKKLTNQKCEIESKLQRLLQEKAQIERKLQKLSQEKAQTERKLQRLQPKLEKAIQTCLASKIFIEALNDILESEVVGEESSTQQLLEVK